jgi:hypothetical protein
VERGTVAPVALHVGLETARGALLRGLAAESLATLDGVWEGAQATEEGWYLRSGAMTVLGLPGEAERVATEALQRQPLSVALRFMQSTARLASGDLSGARGAIAAASEQRDMHPVLLMQQVIVLARQGDRREAERRLQQLLRLFPDHPAVDYAVFTAFDAAVGDVAVGDVAPALAACAPTSIESPLRDARELPVPAFGAVVYEGMVQGEAATGPLVPVRLGLALLEARAPAHVTPNGLSATALDVDGGRWGAALLCVVIAAGAGTSGSRAVAAAFAIGAAWLGLRGMGRLEARPSRDRDRDRDTTRAD